MSQLSDTSDDNHMNASLSNGTLSVGQWMDLTLSQGSSVHSVLQEDDIDDDTATSADASSALADAIDASFSTVSNNRDKLNRFIVTFFPPNAEPRWLKPATFFLADLSWIQVWCGQFEICPTTEKLHVHIYIESVRSKRKRFNEIRQVFSRFTNGCDIRTSKKSSTDQRQGAVNYVLKASKRAPDTHSYIWPLNKVAVAYDPDFKPFKKKVSKAEEDEAKRLWIESKPRFWTWDQIVHESEQSKKLLYSCTWGDKYHKGRHAADKRRTISNVIILYGAGGTGKTTMAQAWGARDDECDSERYYRRNPDDGAFWGGGRTSYKGQRIIHYEEFTGQETLSRLKEVCDIGKQGPAVNVKNGGAILNHETVVFTSNVHPAGWFHRLWVNDPKQFHPFWRRVTKVLFFPSHLPDGRLAIPDENNPPHYIDQTNEWKDWQGSYDSAVAHAADVWPLKLEEPPQPMLLVQPERTSDNTAFFQYCQTGVYPK